MGNSMVDRAICLLDNIYYLRDACYMAIECLIAFTVAIVPSNSLSNELLTTSSFTCAAFSWAYQISGHFWYSVPRGAHNCGKSGTNKCSKYP